MIYRGRRISDSLCCIGLATSVDGVIWARQDTAGHVRSYAVLSGTSGQWDAGDIDFGSVIKIGSTYYLHYDTINRNQREVGLATSTDLVHKTKYAGNPLFTGVTDYDDKTHNGTVDLTAGFFCGDMVHWPRPNGSDRYVFFVPHYTTGYATSNCDVYESNTPLFTKANRTYDGQAFTTNNGINQLAGFPLLKVDSPRIVTDDITSDVLTSSRTGTQILLLAAVYSAAGGWNDVYLVHNRWIVQQLP